MNASCAGIHWLIVLAVGRSGSTSAIAGLNALPMVYMRGEVVGAIGLAMDLLDNADAEHAVLQGPTVNRGLRENRNQEGTHRFYRF